MSNASPTNIQTIKALQDRIAALEEKNADLEETNRLLRAIVSRLVIAFFKGGRFDISVDMADILGEGNDEQRAMDN